MIRVSYSILITGQEAQFGPETSVVSFFSNSTFTLRQSYRDLLCEIHVFTLGSFEHTLVEHAVEGHYINFISHFLILCTKRMYA